MKRIPQLQSLSSEHHQSLRLAKQCKDIAARNDRNELQAFSQQLLTDFNAIWDSHFRHEEQTIFSVAEVKSGELADLCRQLKEEHRTMKKMVEKIAAGKYSLLHEFGQLLHDHTRLEERTLFPMVEVQFSQQELDDI